MRISDWSSDVCSSDLALSLLIPGVAVAPSAIVLFVVLVVIGAIDGLTDVAQNSQALEVQGRIRRSIITRMHGAWSIGTLLGGLTSSRSEEHTSELQSLMRISYAVFCLKKKKNNLQVQ